MLEKMTAISTLTANVLLILGYLITASFVVIRWAKTPERVNNLWSYIFSGLNLTFYTTAWIAARQFHDLSIEVLALVAVVLVEIVRFLAIRESFGRLGVVMLTFTCSFVASIIAMEVTTTVTAQLLSLAGSTVNNMTGQEQQIKNLMDVVGKLTDMVAHLSARTVDIQKENVEMMKIIEEREKADLQKRH
jgi:hypothetical protein